MKLWIVSAKFRLATAENELSVVGCRDCLGGLDELVMKEENGRISKPEERHPAWKEVDEKGLQFEDPTADLLSITPTKSGAFDGNKKEEDVNDDNDTSSNNVRKLSQLFNK